MAVIQAVFAYTDYFISKGVPAIFASFGSSAVLIYGAIESPYAQPRALLGGQFIGALTGICFLKLIHLLPTEQQFLRLEWLGGSLSCAVSIVLMQLTGTLHPPGGATALLATVNPDVRELGWYFLPVILLMSTLALAVALVLNNIQRRYPTFWFTPDTVEDAAVIPLAKSVTDAYTPKIQAHTGPKTGTEQLQNAREPARSPVAPRPPPPVAV
ncbi:hypothetical protein ONZ45_g9562 [Pleurotus djamor]|nr:hypothetical protein ONZ45_g9562 [Pleurotus djamor]